ncbi:right-handed parallel beta-helix repeat-containing protein [Leadbetterella sp. DM7]|uniref:right-handed parallel beta-helix repeat-containing protein n=1 Tax=Leadbetterella sp. DM7 TaxID=3235085 RepID=UPI00349ED036
MKYFPHLLILLFVHLTPAAQSANRLDTPSVKTLFVAPNGADTQSGTQERPLKTLAAALEKAQESASSSITVYLRHGTYYLDKPLQVTSGSLRGKKLLISAYAGEKVTLSGGKKLNLKWKRSAGNLWESAVDFTGFDQLFINGTARVPARYPNQTAGTVFNGTAADALSPERVKRWANPAGGFIHVMHSGQWGDMHYWITGKKGDEVVYEGGFQNNRPSPMHTRYRFVENIREELDAPGEWFLDREKRVLYYYPQEGEKPGTASVEVSVLPLLIELRGTPGNPLNQVTLQNLTFKHTRRTFMEAYEPLMRSDWRIYRGAALLLENTTDCTVTGCEFTDLGGNALFISRYGLNNKVKQNHFHRIGASAVCVVGDTSAVRSGSLEYRLFVPYDQLDKTPGPANPLYPRQCVIEDNLIHDIGQVEKQVAGVQIQLAAQITVRHNSIYQVPRAGINVGDGAFGGHLIEYNDVFDTVLETSDHGAFNSWGRDRFWHPDRAVMDRLTSEHPELILLDALYTTTLRNNRFRCDHGWDIDLDDGSSNYHIYNNLCLQGGIKLREGFYRTVENNIMVNNSFHPHVWFANSHDVFQRNIVMRPYYPIALKGWGKTVDHNFFASEEDLEKAQKNHTDVHSASGPLLFADALHGNYTLPAGSLAFNTGFENIPMDQFGVYSPHLKKLARQPAFPELVITGKYQTQKEIGWLDGRVRAVEGLGDRSAYGLPDERGVIITALKEDGLLARAGLRPGDVLRSFCGEPLSSLGQLLTLTEENKWKGSLKAAIFRNQEEKEIMIVLQR